MSTYQDRVKQEKEELDEKLRSLHNYLDSEGFNKLENRQQYLLSAQYDIMLKYSSVLKERIALFV